MPDVGVLQLSIRDNSESAAGGLEQLSGALRAVKDACKGGFSLSGGEKSIAAQVKALADTVKSNSSVIKNLGTLFNALSNFSKLKDVTLNTQPIIELKSALDGGINIGKAGTELNKMREAFAGDWGEADKATFIIDSMRNIADASQAMAGGNTAGTIKAVAKAISEYTAAVNTVSGGGAHDYLQQQVFSSAESYGTGRYVAEGIKQGIEEGKEAVISAAKELAQSIIDTTRTTLEEHSPSHVARRSGQNYGAGLVEGLVETKGDVQRAATSVAETVNDSMKTVLIGYGSPVMLQQNMSSYLSSPLESYSQRFLYAADAADRFKNNVMATIPALQDQKNAALSVASKQDLAGYSKKSGEELIASIKETAQRTIAAGEEVRDNMVSPIKEAEKEISTVASQVKQDINDVFGTGSIKPIYEDVRFGPTLAGFYGAAEQLKMMKQISAGTGLGLDDIARQLTELSHGAITFGDSMKQTEHAVTESSTRITNSLDNIKSLSGSNTEIIPIDQFIDSYSHVDYLKNKIVELKNELDTKRKLGLISSDDLDKAVSTIQRLQSEYDKLVNETDKAEDSTKSLRDRLDELFQVGKKGTFGKLLSQFARIAKYRFLRAVIRQITQGFREGIENVYYYSKAVGTSFAPSMDSAASSLAQMKNSLGAAVAPALQALIPIMQTVVNWFITGLNYLNQFFALLNGQNTWTRALPRTTEAFKKQETAAKKTGAAIKDLLADWDELNIIQSDTSGAGAVAGTSEAEDYLSMFEEVSTFDNKVKEIVTFIKDNFDTIKTVALAIGEALLAWKVAEGIYDVLRLVGTLKGGIIMSVVGFTLSAAAGKDLAVEGFSAKSVLEAIGGLAASALGGAWIGKALLASAGFGATGLLIGAITGLTIGLAFLVTNFKAHAADYAYGTLTEDANTIRSNVMKYFKTNVEAEVTVTKARISDTESAEKKVGEALAVLEKDYAVAVTLNTGDAYETFKKDVDALIAETNLLIRQRKQNIKIPIIMSGQFGNEAQPLYKSLNTQLDLTEQYITQLGEKIGKLISSGITDGVELEGLKQKLTDIVRAITYGQVSGEFAGNVELAGAKLRNNEYTKDTVEAYYNTYKTERQNLWDQAAAAAISEKADLGATVAAIRERMKQGDPTATVEALADAIYAYNTYDTAARTKQLFEEWVGEGDKVFGEDMRLALSAVMQRNTDQGRRDNILKMVEKGGASSIVSAIYKDISSETGFSIEFLQDLVKTTGIDLMSLFPDDFAKQVREAMIYRLQHSDYTPEQNQAFLNALGIELTPSELIHMTFPDGFKDDTALANKWASQFTEQKPTFSLIYTPPVDDTVYDWETGNIASRDYKTDWDRFMEQEPIIEDVELDIEFDDDSIRELREKIQEALGDDIIDDSERKPLIDLYGEDMYYKVLDEVNDGLDSASMTRLQRMAAAGVLGGNRTVSDVGWTPTMISATETAESNADMQNNISSGTQKGTQDMLGVLRDLLMVAQAINRKDFKVMITPTSTLGATMSKSMEKYGMVTGEN